MKRLSDIPVAVEVTEPEAPYSLRKPPAWSVPMLGPDPSDADDLDDFGKALAHLEDAQEVLIFLQVEEVKKMVPIPVWNMIVRTEQRVTRFLDDHTDWDEDADDQRIAKQLAKDD